MIQIDTSRDRHLTTFGKTVLTNQYCLPDEGFQEAFARASTAFSGGDEELAQRLYNYASWQWFAFATPLLANGGTVRGLPISCFLNYVDDSIHGLAENFRENAFMSTNGGGIGTYWGAIRSVGEVTSRGVDTPGAMSFMHVQDSQMLAYHQGQTRRGAAAAYMDVSHPEIVEFINMRSSTGGDVHRKNENLHHGVNLPDAFMKAVKADGDWDLIDPHSKDVKDTLKARALWVQILQQRVKLGEPYLFFIDTANEALNAALKAKGLRIHHSNLCSEITLPTAEDRTAVCCLSSVNVAKYGEWEPEQAQFISDLVTMLDNALNVFLDTAPTELYRAMNSVRKERSIGLGTLGFHTYLQQRGWSMLSLEAQEFNYSFYEGLQSSAKRASRKLAEVRGEPEDLRGTGMRNAHLLAIAPNASSSIICGGVSPSIEPLVANAFTQKTKSGSHEVRNPALKARLVALGRDNEEVWTSITLNAGSVQHIDFLSDSDKDVFQTASEVDSRTLIDLAADRQEFICQSQSLNLFLPANVTTKVLHQLHYYAWERGLKSLYYLRSSSVKSTSVGVMPEILREAPPEPDPDPAAGLCSIDDDECKACEG